MNCCRVAEREGRRGRRREGPFLGFGKHAAGVPAMRFATLTAALLGVHLGRHFGEGGGFALGGAFEFVDAFLLLTGSLQELGHLRTRPLVVGNQ